MTRSNIPLLSSEVTPMYSRNPLMTAVGTMASAHHARARRKPMFSSRHRAVLNASLLSRPRKAQAKGVVTGDLLRAYKDAKAATSLA